MRICMVEGVLGFTFQHALLLLACFVKKQALLHMLELHHECDEAGASAAVTIILGKIEIRPLFHLLKKEIIA